MAYGDGLAALIGEKYGKKDQFLGIKGKSFAGSLTVAIAALIVSFACMQVFTDLSIPAILFISIMAALFSSLVELVSLNGIDNITLPIASSIFIAVSIHAASTGYFIYLVAIALILGFAFAKDKWSGYCLYDRSLNLWLWWSVVRTSFNCLLCLRYSYY